MLKTPFSGDLINKGVGMSDENDPKPETPEQTEEAPEQLPWLQNVEEDSEKPPLWGIPKEMLALGVGAVLVLAASGVALWVNEREPAGMGNLLGMPAELPPELEREAGAGNSADAAGPPPQATARARGATEKKRAPDKAQASRRAAAKPAELERRSRGSAAGDVVQLGAYSTRARADRAAQTMLRKHFRGFDHSVERASVGGKTVYRLRIQGEGAAARCRSLKRSGGCFVVPH